MPYSRALVVLLVVASSSLGCTLARGVTGQPPGDDVGVGVRDSGRDGGDARDAGDANIVRDTGIDAFTLSDDGGIDAFVPDGGIDAFVPDGGTDAFIPDGGTDAFIPDGGTDAFVRDGGTDAFVRDAGTDAFTPDAFTPDAFTPDAFVPDCSPGQTRCMSGTVFQSCTAGLVWGGNTTCALGCVNAPAPAHCAVFEPSNVTALAAAGGPLTVSGVTAIDTSSCTSAGIAGLAIEAQATGGRSACVLRVTTLTVTSTGVLSAGGDLAFIVVATGDVTIDGVVDVSSYQTDPTFAAFVRGAGSNTGGVMGADGSNTSFADGGGGGGGFCGSGGGGGDGLYLGTVTGRGGTAGTGTGTSSLEPLVGGADGGDGGSNPDSVGPGGGAIQISSFTRIVIGATALFQAAGGGGDQGIEDGNDTNAGGGGGSGGALLLEAPTVTVTTGARFNAGGGGGASGGCVKTGDGRDGADAAESFAAGMLRAPGGTHRCATATGGLGAGDTTASGGAGGGTTVTNASGGGGGGGCVFFRTASGTTPTGVVTNPTTVVGAGTVRSI